MITSFSKEAILFGMDCSENLSCIRSIFAGNSITYNFNIFQSKGFYITTINPKNYTGNVVVLVFETYIFLRVNSCF